MAKLKFVLYCMWMFLTLTFEVESKRKNRKVTKKLKEAVTETLESRRSGKYVIGCYYTNWSQYRTCKTGGCSPADVKFYPENVPPNLCTHVFYAFAVTNNQTGPTEVVKFEWNDDVMFKRMVKVRDSRSPPNFKLLLSFGGWNYCQETGGGNAIMSEVAASPQMRKKFIDSALKIVVDNNFDGFDMDWEYPGKEDKETYTMLMREMADVFHKRNLLVTAAVPLAKSKMEDGFKVKELAEILDLVNVMTYDCHGGSWENRTGLNSPLYTLKTDKDKFSMSDGLSNWYKAGVPKNKLVVGFATYGRSYTLVSKKNRGMFAPSIGGGRQGGGVSGIYSGEKGMEGYMEICQKIAKGVVREKQLYYDKKRVSPYYWYNDKTAGPQWMGFDDLHSYKTKLDWLKKEGFAGAFVWALDFDDFSGRICPLSEGQMYPLIGFINKELGGTFEYKLPEKSLFKYNPKQPRPGGKATARRWSSSSQSEPVKFDPSYNPGRQGCGNRTGNFFDPDNCKSYYVCIFPDQPAQLMPCPGDTFFDGTSCNYDTPDNPCTKSRKT